MSHPRPLWRLAVSALLGVAFLWLAARGASWSQVSGAFATADYRLVAVAAACVVVGTALRTWCWGYLYRPTPERVTFARAWRILLIGQLLNIGVPARAGDVARVYLLGEAGRFPKAAAATSLLVEKFFDMTTFVLILLVISLQVALPPVLERARGGVVVATVALALFVFAAAWRADGLIALLARRGHTTRVWLDLLVEHLIVGLRSLGILRRWQAVLWLQGGYLAVWAALGLSHYLVFRALGLDLPVVAALLVLAVVQLGTAVPSTPGKVGVFQYLSVLALGPFGVGQGVALSYGILLHLVSYAPPIVLGGAGLWVELPGLRRAGVVAAGTSEPSRPGAVG